MDTSKRTPLERIILLEKDMMCLIEAVENIEADIEKMHIMKKGLEEIKDFAKKHSGCGYTCGKMAEKILEEVEEG